MPEVERNRSRQMDGKEWEWEEKIANLHLYFNSCLIWQLYELEISVQILRFVLEPHEDTNTEDSHQSETHKAHQQALAGTSGHHDENRDNDSPYPINWGRFWDGNGFGRRWDRHQTAVVDDDTVLDDGTVDIKGWFALVPVRVAFEVVPLTHQPFIYGVHLWSNALIVTTSNNTDSKQTPILKRTKLWLFIEEWNRFHNVFPANFKFQ